MPQWSSSGLPTARAPGSGLDLVISAQREACRALGADFFDQRAAMGGSGAYARWASAVPALARPDGIHFTAQGYERLARFAAEDLVAIYNRAKVSPSFQSALKQDGAGEALMALATKPARLPDTLPALRAVAWPTEGTSPAQTGGGQPCHLLLQERPGRARHHGRTILRILLRRDQGGSAAARGTRAALHAGPLFGLLFPGGGRQPDHHERPRIGEGQSRSIPHPKGSCGQAQERRGRRSACLMKRVPADARCSWCAVLLLTVAAQGAVGFHAQSAQGYQVLSETQGRRPAPSHRFQQAQARPHRGPRRAPSTPSSGPSANWERGRNRRRRRGSCGCSTSATPMWRPICGRAKCAVYCRPASETRAPATSCPAGPGASSAIR